MSGTKEPEVRTDFYGSQEVDLSQPGANLIRAIEQAVVARGIYNRDAAKEIGITPTELSRLKHGHYEVANLSRERIQNIANFLNIPVLATMLLAGQIEPADFYQNSQSDEFIHGQVERATQFILNDPDWGAVAPKALYDKDVGVDVKLYLIWAYEQATGLVLIKGAADYLQMIEDIENQSQG